VKQNKKIRKFALGFLCVLLCLQAVQLSRAAEEVLGQNAQRLQACNSRGNTNVETDFGNFMADAMAWVADADVALLPSGDLGNHLQQGSVTESALDFCLMRDAPLGSAWVSPAQLCAYLEHGISHITIKEDESIDWDASYFDGYLQVSGISVIYDLAAPKGERVLELKLSDGELLDREDGDSRLLLVSTLGLLEGEYGFPQAEVLEQFGTEQAAAAAYVRHLGTVRTPAGDRTKLLGARSFWNDNGRMIGGLVAVVGIVIAVSTMEARKRKKREKFVPRGYESSEQDFS